jgi:hypothetical protein
MRLAARGTPFCRARSRSAISLLLLVTWVATMLVAPPPASATGPPGPGITAAEPSPGRTASPAWTFTLPATSSSSTDTVDPVTGDTSTATIEITHRAECALTPAAATAAFADCGTSTSAPQSITFRPATDLTVAGDYVFAVHDVQTSTESTTVQHADGTAPTGPNVTAGPTSSTTDDSSRPYTFDNIAPVLSVTGSPAVGQDPSPRWTVSSDGPETVGCTLFEGTSATGTVVLSSAAGCSAFPAGITLATDTTYTLAAQATDAVGNTTARDVATYTLDRTAPAVTITPATSTGGSASPGWAVSVTDATATTVTCDLTPAPATPLGPDCAAYASWSAPAQGPYTLTATATDAAGNTTSASSTYTYDTPPGAPVLTGPATGNGTSVTWTVSVEPTATVTCQVVGPAGYAASPTCTGGTATATLPGGTGYDGAYVLTATATDAGGSTSASATFTLDRTPPPTPPFDPAGSTGPQRTPAVSWPFTATGGTTTCALVEQLSSGETVGTAAGCASPYTADLSPGTWWLRVTVVDTAGNSATADGPHVTYDATPPDPPTVTRTSPSPTNNRSTTWTLGTAEAGATLLCSWTGPAGYTDGPTGCPASYAFTLPVGDGTFTLHVAARDAAGNISTETTGAVDVDQTAPTVAFTAGPTSPRSDSTASWSFSSSEPAARSECQLVKRTLTVDDLLGWNDCTATPTLSLSAGDGTYVLQVRVTDAAGNVTTPVAESGPVTLDTTGPGAPAVDGPSGWGSLAAVRWTITPPNDPTGVAGYLCRLVRDGATATAAWTACGPFYDVVLPAEATYRLDVVSVDALGNTSQPVTSSADYLFDPNAPSAAVFTGSDETGNLPSHTWTWSTAESNLTEECRLFTVVGTTRSLVHPMSGCTSPWTESLASPTAGTTYVLEVTLLDRARNRTAADGPAYVLDTVKPATPAFSAEPTGTARNAAVSYAFSIESGSTAACRLLFAPVGSPAPPAPVGAGAYTSCGSPWNVSLTSGDGSYQADVLLTDAARNVSDAAQSGVYVLDATGPAAPTFISEPTGTANSRNVTWTWTGETPSTATCTLSLTPVGASASAVVAGPVACNGGTLSTTLSDGDGLYQLAVQLTDRYGNPGVFGVSAGYTLDTTAPGAPTVSGPSGTGNTTSASYSLASPVEAGATAECRLLRDGAVVDDWGTCTLPRTTTLGADGSYVLQVRLTDRYGNLGPAGASPAYLLDTKLPTAPSVSAPASPSSNSSPVFTIGTDADTTTSCTFSRGAVVVADAPSCRGSFTGVLAGQPDGDYVLSVTATDPAGNTSFGASAAYTYDTTRPVAPAVTGPAGPSQTRAPIFSWIGELGAGAECSLQEKDGSPGSWGSCATPYAPALPADGTWVLSVRLTDAAGNVGDVGASGAYVLDTTAPTAPLVTAPISPGRDLAPSWSAKVEDGSTTECRLTGPGQGGGWSHCTFPLTTPVSGDGTYTLEVRTTDVAGNVSPVGSGDYLLDTTAPAAPVVVQPTGPGRSRAPSVSFTTEPGTAGICRLTRGAVVLSDGAPCSDPATLDLTGLPDGAYTLSVRAVDAAGNVGPAGTATYVLDTTAPAVPTWVLVSGSPSSNRAPVFGFSAENGSSVSCRLTTPAGAVKDLPCGSPVTIDLSGSSDGDYVLTVRATDPAGNTSGAATTTYHLDSTAPMAPRVVGPPTPGSARNPVWRISSASPAECRLTRNGTVVRDWASCGTSYAADLYGQPDGAYYLEARVVGTTAATLSRYRLDTIGPAVATLVGPPSPGTDLRPTWAVSTADTTATAECRVLVFTGLLRDWTACPVSPAGSLYTLDLTGRGDGTYTLAVRLTDGAGNVGAVATSDYVLDTSAPAAVGVVAPPSPGNDPTPTWTLTSAAGVKLECRILSGQKVISDFAPCAGTFTADLTGLPDGTYTLAVHALSAAGTPGPETTSGYVLDTTAAGVPGTLSGPTGPSRDRAPRWTFTIPPGTTALCTVTLGTRVLSDGPCTSPYVLDLSNAVDGTYTLTVRTVDQAGNLGSPTTAGYTLKTTPPPAPTLTQQPGSPSSTVDPRWGFSLFRGTRGQCRLVSAGAPLEDWGLCSSPVRALLSGKPDGPYTMQVRALDVAGNTSAAVSGDYVFDRSAAPLSEFVSTPATPGNDTTPTWLLAAPAAAPTPSPAAAVLRLAALIGAPQTECRLTTPHGAGSWATCAGSYTATTTGDGLYLLEVRAFDTAGDRGPASTSSYLLDTKSPGAPRFTEPIPPAAGNDPQVAWSWAEDDNQVECRLLRGGAALTAFAACSPPYVASFGRLGEATYGLELRAVDAAGNVGPVAQAIYRYDITPPAAPAFTSRPPTRGRAADVAWTFTQPTDAVAVCVLSRNGTVVSEGSCSGTFGLDLRGQQPATWALSVHLVDSAGNAGPPSSGSYTLTTAISGGRVDGAPTPAGGTPTGSSPGGSAPGPAPGSSVIPSRAGEPSQPAADPNPFARLPDAVRKGAHDVAKAAAALPGALPGTDVPAAIKNVLSRTITKPQLPLALLVIVLLFLLVQNRIDRRDPKLASAPNSPEPELAFGPIVRPGGATA